MFETLITATVLSVVMTGIYKLMMVWMLHEISQPGHPDLTPQGGLRNSKS